MSKKETRERQIGPLVLLEGPVLFETKTGWVMDSHLLEWLREWRVISMWYSGGDIYMDYHILLEEKK